jgi:hypothetical protein
MAVYTSKQLHLRHIETGELLDTHLRKLNRDTAEEVAHQVTYHGGYWTWEVKQIMLLLVS